MIRPDAKPVRRFRRAGRISRRVALGLAFPVLVTAALGPVPAHAQEPVAVQDSAATASGWLGFALGLSLHGPCDWDMNCVLLPGASLQFDLGSRLSLQGSAHTLWNKDELGDRSLFAGRAKFHVRGGREEERLFVYGMMGEQRGPYGATYRIREFGIGLEWPTSASSRGSVYLGVSKSTSFSNLPLTIGVEIQALWGR